MEISQHRSLPGGRAVLGGVLMAVAVVGVFSAYTRVGQDPTDPIIVTTRAIRVGEVLEASDLRQVDGELPSDDAAFGDVERLVGRVALGPMNEGEVVQAGSVTAEPATPGVHEVAVALPRRQIAVGRLKPGERVDVFVTYDERTSSVVRGAEVVQIEADDAGSLTSDREVSLVIAVPSGDAVAAVVHALRTGDVTVVRSTFATPSVDDPLEYEGTGETSVASADEAG